MHITFVNLGTNDLSPAKRDKSPSGVAAIGWSIFGGIYPAQTDRGSPDGDRVAVDHMTMALDDRDLRPMGCRGARSWRTECAGRLRAPIRVVPRRPAIIQDEEEDRQKDGDYKDKDNHDSSVQFSERCS